MSVRMVAPVVVKPDGGPGGGEARAGLKDTVPNGVEAPASVEEEGEPPGHAGKQPDEAHSGKALPQEKGAVCGQKGQGQADAQNDCNTPEEWGDVLSVEQGAGQGQRHRGGHHQLHPSQNLQNQLDIHCKNTTICFKYAATRRG